MMASRETQFRIAVATTLLTWCVIMLGAYVRLSDAGLGCPDWPGCYGRIIAPSSPETQALANAAFPHRPVETDKAWKEMVHRYAAGLLGLAIAALAVIAWRRRHEAGQPLALSVSLLALVVFQALLGMWTVTLLLKPAVVTLHLLGGMATLALLCWLSLRLAPRPRPPIGRDLRPLASLALAVLAVQIMLGGWTSTNYAAFFCSDFPTCQGQWLPPTDFVNGFKLWHQGVHDYEGGILSNEAGVAVHLTHRLGAVATLFVLIYLGARLVSDATQGLPRWLGLALILAVLSQFALGVANVLLRLPLPLAVAHNGLAALLLALTVSIGFLAWSGRPAPKETA